MSEQSRYRTDETFEWAADCPRCGGTVDRSNVQCPNCGSCRFKFVREEHGSEGSNWTECRLECDGCNLKTKSVICPHDDGTTIAVPLIRASLPSIGIPRLDERFTALLKTSISVAVLVYFFTISMSRPIADAPTPEFPFAALFSAAAKPATVLLIIYIILKFIRFRMLKPKWQRFNN